MKRKYDTVMKEANFRTNAFLVPVSQFILKGKLSIRINYTSGASLNITSFTYLVIKPYLEQPFLPKHEMTSLCAL